LIRMKIKIVSECTSLLLHVKVREQTAQTQW
jgi:hypothetical protein